MRYKKQQLKVLFFPFLAVSLVLSMFMSATSQAEDVFGTIDNTKSSLEKWVETQRIISKEKADLRLSKEMLNERIDLVSREIETLEKKIKEAGESIAEADKKRAEMLEKNENLKQATSVLAEKIAPMEKRLADLLKRLPKPAVQRVRPLSQRLVSGKKESDLEISERYQNVVGILNEMDKFNREITVTSELRDLEDGRSVEVASMYLGVGQGYYVSGNDKFAGNGFGDENGWQWKQDNSAAANISEAIKILENEKAASFVRLPVEIK